MQKKIKITKNKREKIANRSDSSSESSDDSLNGLDTEMRAKVRAIRDERKMRKKVIEKEIEQIKALNNFKAFSIDAIVHKENSEVLAEDYYHSKKQFSCLEKKGLEPLVISEALVGRKRRNSHSSERSKLSESSYASDNSYYFVINDNVKLRAITRIQTWVRKWLARKRYVKPVEQVEVSPKR